MNSEHTLFSVSNHHSDKCGEPPVIDGDAPGYYSYWENEHGEQFVFVYDYDAEHGTLWFGDAGWDRPYPVEDGSVGDIVLSEAEQAWLTVCWLVATRYRKYRGEARERGEL